MTENDDNKNTDTRQEILRAALDLFSQKGYYGTSIREIAEKVGIRKSSIYNHFQGKEHLFEVLLSEYGPGSIARTFHNSFDYCDIEDPYSFLKGFCKKILELIKRPDEQKILKIMLVEHNNELVRDAIKEKLFNEKRIMLAEFFNHMIEEGKIKKGDPLTYANEFIGQMIFLRILHLLHVMEDEEFVLDEFVAKHVDFFWNAIKLE